MNIQLILSFYLLLSNHGIIQPSKTKTRQRRARCIHDCENPFSRSYPQLLQMFLKKYFFCGSFFPFIFKFHYPSISKYPFPLTKFYHQHHDFSLLPLTHNPFSHLVSNKFTHRRAALVFPPASSLRICQFDETRRRRSHFLCCSDFFFVFSMASSLFFLLFFLLQSIK